MVKLGFDELKEEEVIRVAKFMAIAAKTAPKAKGIDNLAIVILTGDDKDRLVKEMLKLSEKYPFFERDAENVEKSDAVIVIGLKNPTTLGLNCGACGFNSCEELKKARETANLPLIYRGPICAMELLNLGIALGSAAKTASDFNVDNRLMFSAGVAAIKAGLVEADIAIGIPLSATGKSIYFDRAWPKGEKQR